MVSVAGLGVLQTARRKNRANMAKERRYEIYSIDNAPEASKPLLQATASAMGYEPSLLGVMAESPELIQGFMQLKKLMSACTLNSLELEVVTMAIGRENGCTYCIALHTKICAATKVDAKIVEALRAGTKLPDERLNVLAEFSRAIVRDKGYIAQGQWNEFLAHGFTRRQGMEILIVASQQVLSNYANHLASAPLDPQLSDFAWSKYEG